MNDESVVRRVIDPLYRVRGWMKFAGVLSIIQGVFMLVSIWGILICWVPIWMGLLLFAASDHVRTAFESDNEEACRVSMEKLGTYFQILGIFVLVMFFMLVLGLMAGIAIPAFIKAREAMGQ